MTLEVTFRDGTTGHAFGSFQWIERYLWNLEDSGKAADVVDFKVTA
jgi:hypothetical protein